MILKKNNKESFVILKKKDFKLVKQYIKPGDLICYSIKDKVRYNLFRVKTCLIKNSFIEPSKTAYRIRLKPYSICGYRTKKKDPNLLWREKTNGCFSLSCPDATLRKAGVSESFAFIMAETFISDWEK